MDRIEGGTLRVGVIDAPPFTDVRAGKVTGVEADLIREFAASEDADVSFTVGTEKDLTEALAGFQLDVVIGGITTQTPYAKDVAVTRPYLDTQLEVGQPPGTDVPDNLGGTEIWVERGSPAAAALKEEEEDAIPVFYDDATEIDGPALVESYELEPLGLESIDYILSDDEHAMAVPMGENALMTELEYFLLDNEAYAARLLEDEIYRTLPDKAGVQ
jgi:polar amino acid transport system substrate-binding protein